MNDNTSIAIVISIFFISVGGCTVGVQHEDNKVLIEKEKTKQIELQLKKDSLRLFYKIN